ncbi:MAG: Lrp/AsnC family transcriptional regulator [Desulforudis sp.]|jgi:Lrp/AsnC family leucine-responsive transcriptional regulator|nr:Lrp/AsnC family transcriptional regulator [Clostridia bacterium]RJX19966.1 MAG: Lrp/AsnC family transcriptional regulator [Desulforudis sp.]
MAVDSERLLDEIGWQLLLALQENARLSFAELGRRVGLSLPAVAERVRRMEDAGIITGYHARLDPGKIGLPLTAFIRVNCPADRYPRIIESATELPEVLECHHVSGGDSFVIKVVASSIPHLESLIKKLSPFGRTTTSIVLSSPVTKTMLHKSTT